MPGTFNDFSGSKEVSGTAVRVDMYSGCVQSGAI